MDFALENGMDAWALTDHGHMNSYAHAQFHQWDLNKKGKQFKYIPGVEFYLHPDLKQWSLDFAAAQAKKTKLNADDESEGVIVENESESKQTKWYDPVRRRHHLVVIPKSQKGLKNLFTLVSRSYSEGFYKFPRIDYRMLKEHGEDLIVSTACLAGPMSYEIMKHHQLLKWEDLRPGIDTKQSFEAIQNELKNIVDKIVDAVGMENFSLELQFNKLPAQHLINQHLIRLSRDTGVKLIATADSHYPRPEMWKDRELYKKLGWMGSDKFEAGTLPESTDELECELYPKNAQQMWDAYKDSVKHLSQIYPDISWKFYDDDIVCDAIERTHEIAHQQICDVNPDTTMKLPSFVVEKGKSDFETLVDAVKQGMKYRGLDDKPEYIERMNEELDVIKQKDFSRYFLTMKAIMDAANENMLVGVGRGSGASSLVNYVLGITGVDPIKYELLFARFISMGREEYPDVDCLDSRHLIRLTNGTLRQIQDLNIGDKIFDIEGNTQEVEFVYTRNRKENEKVYRLLVSCEDTYGIVVCTSEHRLVLHDGTFERVENIETGAILHGTPHSSIVLDKRECDSIKTVTDITVTNHHTFQFVPFDTYIMQKDQSQYIIDVDGYINDDVQENQLTDIIAKSKTYKLGYFIT
jgi:DNA polymerase III alpha subunit